MPNDLFEIVSEALANRQERPPPRPPNIGQEYMTNYLSGIVFVGLMAVGLAFWGRDVFVQQPAVSTLLLAGGWTAVSLFIASSIRIAAQWEKALVFRLGRFRGLRGPGVYALIPLLDHSRHVDTRILTLHMSRQEAITQDNVPLSIDGVIFMKVIRPDHAVINIQDYAYAISQYAQTALRDVIGARTLDAVLSEREAVGQQIQSLVEGETEHWGLEVEGIRIQDIILPEDLKKVMSRQAAAEREKRANITKSEGDRLAAENLAAAAATMATSPGAMQLRTLQTLDGLGPGPSNTVVLGVPVEILETLQNLSKLSRGAAEKGQ